MCEDCVLGNSRFQCTEELRFNGEWKISLSVQISLAIQRCQYCLTSWDQPPGDPRWWMLKRREGVMALDRSHATGSRQLKLTVKLSHWLKSSDISRQRVMPQILG